MRTIAKQVDDYIIADDGHVIAVLMRDAFGTHGHYRGWQHYKPLPDGRMMWCGVDKRIVPDGPDGPAIFSSIKEAKIYYGIA